MKLTTQSATVTALLAAAVVAATGVAHADSTAAATPPPDRMHTVLAPGVAFDDNLTTGVAAVRTPLGSVAVQPGALGVRDAAGNTVLGTAIDVPVATADSADTDRHPASSDVAGQANTAAQPAQAAPGDLMSDINQSVAAAAPHMGLGMAVGALGGSVIGIALGCPFGIATGGTLMSLASAGTMTIPAIAASCVVGAVAVGGLGASLGGAAVAIPVGIAAGTQKFNQLQAQRARASANPGPSNPIAERSRCSGCPSGGRNTARITQSGAPSCETY